MIAGDTLANLTDWIEYHYLCEEFCKVVRVLHFYSKISKGAAIFYLSRFVMTTDGDTIKTLHELTDEHPPAKLYIIASFNNTVEKKDLDIVIADLHRKAKLPAEYSIWTPNDGFTPEAAKKLAKTFSKSIERYYSEAIKVSLEQALPKASSQEPKHFIHHIVTEVQSGNNPQGLSLDKLQSIIKNIHRSCL